MWGDDHLRMQPERVILRQGFNGEDIQYRARQPAAIQRLQNIVIHHMFAAPAVDEYRACGKPIEQRPGENTASLFGERQNVDQRIQLSKKFTGLRIAVIAPDAGELFLAARPARNVIPSPARRVAI